MGKMQRAPATVAPQKKTKKQSYPEQVATVSIHLAELRSRVRAAELKLEAFKGGLPPLPLSAVAGTMVGPLASILEMQREMAELKMAFKHTVERVEVMSRIYGLPLPAGLSSMAHEL